MVGVVNVPSGSGNEVPLVVGANVKQPTSWSRDGRFIAYDSTDFKTRGDIWIVPMFGDRKPFPFRNTAAEESAAAFSPDGRWIAYESNESGRYAVYVVFFPSGVGKWQISTKGDGGLAAAVVLIGATTDGS